MKTVVRREPYRGFESHTLRDVGAANRDGRWSWPAPSLLMIATVVAAPALLQAGLPWVLVVLVVVPLGFALAVVHVRRRPHGPRAARAAMIVQALLGLTGFLIVLVLDVVHGPVGYGLLGAALLVALATVRPVRLRVLLQTTTVTSYLTTAMLRGEPAGEVLVTGLLLAAVAAVAGGFATEFLRIQLATAQARAQAEQRAALLAEVLAQPVDDVSGAAEAAVRSLRALGFDAAGVALVEGELLEVVYLDGIPRVENLRRGQGLAWEAIERDVTIDLDDYQTAPQRLHERHGLRAVVVTPLRVDGRPAGIVMGATHEVGGIGAQQREVVEVLASHLGAVVETVGQEQAQTVLLERLARLDQMRTGFVGAVSSELRDPLTVVQGVSQTLARHPEVATASRAALLARMNERTDDLVRTVDAVLDFSRFQVERREAAPASVAVVGLLEELAAELGIDELHQLADATDPAVVCRLDPSRARHALELLLLAGGRNDPAAGPPLVMRCEPTVVCLELRRPLGTPSTLVRSLAVQLLVSAGGDADLGPPLTVCFPLVEPPRPVGALRVLP